MKLIFYIAVPALGIWTLVEFILYVAHLDPFNWWSLWALIVDLVLAICMAVDSSIRDEKARQERIERNKNPFGKSRFQQHLEEAQRQQKEARKNP